MTSGRNPSGTKITEEKNGGNPYCSAAAAGDPQVSRVWSGHPAVLQKRGLMVGKLTNRKQEVSTARKRMTTQKSHPKVTNIKDQR